MIFAGNKFAAQFLPCLIALVCLAGASGAHANGFRVRYAFCSQPLCSDGLFPQAGLLRDAAGNLYGTTYLGGGTGCGGSGCGVIFKLARDGTETVLHSFTGGTDGSMPAASLIEDKSGNLYGTASAGGTNNYGN